MPGFTDDDLLPQNQDLTPDPKAGASLTQAQGGTTGSATSGAQFNTSGSFDPISGTPNSADQTVPANAESVDNNLNVKLQAAPRSPEMIQSNDLNDYIDVIYNISFGIVSYSAVQSFRTDNVQGVFVPSNQYLVFACTADALTNANLQANEDINYYNIQTLIFTSFLGHLPPNPLVAVAVDGKMKMYEPYGFALREDLRAMAQQLGYPEATPPNQYVYRLEIWFSGYDPITGAWTKQIPISCPRAGGSGGNSISSIIYYCVVTEVESKVTAVGTFHEASFQTISHYTTRPEHIVMHHDSIGKGGIHIDGSGKQTFKSFLQQLANKLRSQVLYDTQNQIDVTYEFTGLKPLFDAQFITDVNVDFSTGVSYKAGDGSHSVSANSMDIYTLIHNVMINLDLVRQLLLREDDPRFVDPGTHWNIRTNIKELTNPDPDINTQKKYIFQYIFEPVLSYRSRMSELNEYNLQVDPANQLQRVKNMIAYGMLYRWYDYYFTSNNSEIVDFQFVFKTFFYQQIPYPGPDRSLRGQGHNTPDLNKNDGQQPLANATGSQQQTVRQVVVPNLLFSPSGSAASEGLNSLLNLAAPPSTTNNSSTTNNANTHGYRHRGSAAIMGALAGDSSAAAYANKALTARDQYLRYEMTNATMTVRFDPVWLLNPYMSGGDSTPKVPIEQTTDGTFVYAHTDRMVYLNAFAPNQKSFMNDDSSIFNIRETPIMAGFYQVLTVINEFDGGRFVQKLNMLKFENLNYFFAGLNHSAFISQTGANGASGSGADGGTAGGDPNASSPLG